MFKAFVYKDYPRAAPCPAFQEEIAKLEVWDATFRHNSQSGEVFWETLDYRALQQAPCCHRSAALCDGNVQRAIDICQ